MRAVPRRDFLIAAGGVLVLAVFVAALIVYQRTRPTEDRAEPSKPSEQRKIPVARVGAMELFEEYAANPIAADARYKGKVIEVAGTGSVIRADGDGYDFGFAVVEQVALFPEQIALLSPREQTWYREGHPPNVIAHLAKSSLPEAAKLAPGASVRVVGTVRGSKRADAYRDFVVELDDCKLVP